MNSALYEEHPSVKYGNQRHACTRHTHFTVGPTAQQFSICQLCNRLHNFVNGDPIASSLSNKTALPHALIQNRRAPFTACMCSNSHTETKSS